jgi:hypothetical protein
VSKEDNYAGGRGCLGERFVGGGESRTAAHGELEVSRIVDREAVLSDPASGFDEAAGGFAFPESEARVECPDSGKNGAVHGGVAGRDEPRDVAGATGDRDRPTSLDQIEQLAEFGFGFVGPDRFERCSSEDHGGLY